MKKRKRKPSKNILMILILMFIILCYFNSCEKNPTATEIPSQPKMFRPRIIYIDAAKGNDSTGDGTALSPYKTITKGLSQANSGDGVQVGDGIYSSSIGENFPIHMKEAVKLIGAGPASSIIDGSGHEIIIEGANYAVFEGFTIKNIKGIAIRCNSTSPTIKNNVIEDSRENWASIGISVSNSSLQIINNTIRDMNVCAISTHNSDPIIENNIITKNNGGIHCYDGLSVKVTGNTVTENSINGILFIRSSGEIINNDFSPHNGEDNPEDISCEDSNPTGYDNTGDNNGKPYCFHCSNCPF